MIKSRATFSWFYYYFQVLYDGGPPEPPLHVIRVNMKCGKEGKVGGGSVERQEHLCFTHCASK